MFKNSYVTYHLHSDRSLLDSCTNYKDYIDYASEIGQKAICFTEHGLVLDWVAKKLYCARKGIKYIHGVECYLTEGIDKKVRDNYHTILIAKNYDGVREINSLISRSEQPDHFYYKNRITFDEFLSISENIISTSACLAGPLAKLPVSHPYYERLAKKYTYYEIQPHRHPDQISYNQHLIDLAQTYNKPLIAGTDTHSLNKYKAECRSILQKAKHIAYSDEDSFDLTYMTYDELVDAFRKQRSVDECFYMEAIENTNRMSDMIDDFELDTTFKYPILYGSPEKDAEMYKLRIEEKFNEKIKRGIIPKEQIENFQKAIKEESRVFEKISMCGFMLSMSEFVCWCKENDIPVGFNRGSCGGSRVAYILDIIDLNPETWHTVFSRFANEDRTEIGDIDVDLAPDDRDKLYNYIIQRFGQDHTAYILAIGTISSKGTIDEIGRALSLRWEEDHDELNKKKNPYSLSAMKEVKDLFESNPDEARRKYKDIFYYYDGLIDTAISQSMHPAGIVVSPVTLYDNYGCLIKDEKVILQIDMEEIHEVSLVKYDILGLKNIQIIRDCCRLAGIKYPKSHEINWNNSAVWNDLLRSPVGIFQFEGSYAYTSLKSFKPQSIADMSLVTAAIRPSGASYRDDLLKRKVRHNPSDIIDAMLSDELGYLIYQEDTIKFLQQICGLSGSEADNIRRAIGRKDKERLDAALPAILEGYCAKSNRPREESEKEAKEFLQIIEDSAAYQFGYNHSIGYCMIGYLCALLRYYYPHEFITAFLNNAMNDEDIANGCRLCGTYGIKITPPRFGISRENYVFDKEKNIIAMGLSSIKFMNKKSSLQLYEIGRSNKYNCFVDVLYDVDKETSVNTRQRDILIKVDYFKEFGDVIQLQKIAEAFDYFKSGNAKSISKSSSCKYLEYVKQYSTGTNKNGVCLKSYSIYDCMGMLRHIEHDILREEHEHASYIQKIKWQLEYLSSVQPSGKSEDRWIILINSIRPVSRKSDGKRFGYNISYTSIGSGKTGNATILSKNYIFDIKEGYLLKTKPNWWVRSGKYFNLNRYEVIS